MIRGRLPGVRIRVRLDGGFAHPAVLAFLDAQPRLEYVVAMAKNSVLKSVAESGMRRARQFSRRSGKTEHIYGEVRHKAGKWPRLRRIIKAEVVRAADKEPRDNPRFVITNMKQSPQWIYEQVYCQHARFCAKEIAGCERRGRDPGPTRMLRDGKSHGSASAKLCILTA
ncbi:MAG: transposase, partial [Candidatus Sulfotelmatobacter sp.]